ncbi:MAG: FtsX-like permease family protein [Actinomycetia bacterium]|nr:FtsX-like permease family protein [Actinomycetes bacterium]
MTFFAAAILAILLPPILFDLFRRPTVRRLALRNIRRRKGEASLVVLGSLLATALITASFVVGDSFDSSVRDIGRTFWGPTDEMVPADDPAHAAATAERLAGLTQGADPVLDGVLPVAVVRVAMSDDGTGADRVGEATVRLLELDLEAASSFGGTPADTGLASVGTVEADEIVLNERLAGRLGVEAGNQVQVHAGDQTLSFTVDSVVPRTGLAGFGEALVGPGAVSAVARVDEIDSSVIVSNTGGVFGGADRTDEATTAIRSVLGADTDVTPVKRSILDEAAVEGAETTAMFGTIGGFSVLAGILLLINLFVMLAEERTSELGAMRALGLRRHQILRSFSMEGAVYGLVAAVIGVIVGIGIGQVLILASGGAVGNEPNLTLVLSIDPRSLLSAGIIGFGISQLTVFVTSWRISRLDVIRAMRELPASPGGLRRRRSLIFGALGIAAGAVLFLALPDEPMAALAGPSIAALSTIPLLSRLFPRRPAIIGPALAVLVWSVLVFSRPVMDQPPIEAFLIQGALMVGAAVLIAGQADRVWARIGERLPGGGISGRLAMAHPLARATRTGLLLAMYALVIFTVTFMSVFNSVFQAQVPQFAINVGGHYDMLVDSNPTAPLGTADFTDDRVESVMAVDRQVMRFALPGEVDPDRWRWVSAVGTGLDPAAMPPLEARADSYTDDIAVWQAVQSGRPVMVVDDDTFFDDNGVDMGSEVRILDEGGHERTVTVAGSTEQGWMIDAGVWVSESTLDGLDYDARGTRVYLEAAEGTDVSGLAADIEGRWLERGADALGFIDAAEAEADEQEAFLSLLRGFLGLGLLIGIAGLGVVLVRAVRERRRQIGMLRAVGIQSAQIRRAFVIEAAFVGVQGVALGVGLGLLSSWQVLTQSSAIEDGLSFVVPWFSLAVIVGVTFGASLLAAVGPAMRAGRVMPAAALRTA